MKLSPIVFITGASGAIGPIVVKTFLDTGYRVRTYSRTPPAVRLFDPSIEHCCGDIADPAVVQEAMDGAEIVIHLAALLHITNPAPEMRSFYVRNNIAGTQAVVDAAQQVGVKRLVFSSTIAVYGEGDKGVLSEATTPHPNTYYGETKLAAESIVLQPKGQDGVPLGVVLRLASTYGAHVKGNYRRLVQSLARGTFIPIGPGDNQRTLIYEQDVANAMLLAATKSRAAGKIFNLSDGHYHSMREIVDTICDALGRKPPRLALPIAPIRMAAGLLEDGARAFGLRAFVGRATIDKYIENVQINSQSIQTHLGFTPHYSLATGWRETIQAMRAAGEL